MNHVSNEQIRYCLNFIASNGCSLHSAATAAIRIFVYGQNVFEVREKKFKLKLAQCASIQHPATTTIMPSMLMEKETVMLVLNRKSHLPSLTLAPPSTSIHGSSAGMMCDDYDGVRINAIYAQHALTPFIIKLGMRKELNEEMKKNRNIHSYTHTHTRTYGIKSSFSHSSAAE